MNNRRLLRTALFVLGLVVEISGFLVSKAERIPFVMRLVSPSYVRSLDGLKRLDSDLVLLPGQPGFPEISEIYMRGLANNPKNDPRVVAQLRVVRINRMNAEFLVTAKAARQRVNLFFTLSNGQKGRMQLETLKAEVEELKADKLFEIGLLVFAAGVLLQIAGFFLVRV